MSLYRLYIDESGHHRYQASEHVAERYLGLTGLIINKTVYEEEVVPRIESLRSLFYTDYDLRPPLHLSDIRAFKGSFSKLNDPKIEERFNSEFVSLLQDVDYKIVTVVIDKNEHQDRYIYPEHPYHYTLACMLERYCNFLRHINGCGDVMVESRGKKENSKIGEAYSNFYYEGTKYASPVHVQERLTSEKIKIKTKDNLVQGLEFADMIALNSKFDVLYSFQRINNLTENYTKTVIDTIQPKYYQGFTGPNGNGKKFL